MHFVCNLLFSLCMSCFTHSFLPILRHFFENLLPALTGKHDFENYINATSCRKQLLRPPNRMDYTPSGPVYGTWDLQNRWEKCVFLVYGPSLGPLFAPMCSTACILNEIFIFSPCFRHNFAKKSMLHSETTSHKDFKLTLSARYVVDISPWYFPYGLADFELHTARKICRMNVARISSSWISRLWIAYCPQAMSYFHVAVMSSSRNHRFWIACSIMRAFYRMRFVWHFQMLALHSSSFVGNQKSTALGTHIA